MATNPYYNQMQVGQAAFQPYQQPLYTAQPYQQPMMQPRQPDMIWVQGEAGAKSFMVAPNTTVQLWDSEDQVIYLKSADASGMPNMKILDYTIRQAGNQQAAPALMQSDYVTRDELSAFEEKIKKMIGGTDDGKSDF